MKLSGITSRNVNFFCATLLIANYRHIRINTIMTDNTYLDDRLAKLKPVTNNVNELFGEILQQLRRDRNLPLRKLQEMSGVPNPVISSIEKGKRCCGTSAANKLADALYGLNESPSKLIFLYAAASTLKSGGIIDSDNPYPPAVFDMVSAKLRSMKIRARDISLANITPGDKGKPGNDISIELHDGRQYHISVNIEQQG
jgi:transcriptional regulator with XRE-family HTH domain